MDQPLLPLTQERPLAAAPEEEGLFFHAPLSAVQSPLSERYAGRFQCVYIDPPFGSGQQFSMKVSVTESEWKNGGGRLTLPAYRDSSDLMEAQSLLQKLCKTARTLLCDTGLLFVHVDWRLSGRARQVLDELFGEDHIVNEIIWSYQTGGRARHHFSRKHDTILLYRKGEDYFFDGDAVAEPRKDGKRNHMRRQVDADGRTYRTIRSAGKLYTYYDDAPATPGDVWDDLQMQQRDPQRTGYDTQKPLRLLQRIIACSTRPGDWVADLCCGSGTTLAAAHSLGRRFLGVDPSDAALLCVRRRLSDAAVTYMTPCPPEAASRPGCRLAVQLRQVALSDWELTLLCGEEKEDCHLGIGCRLDGWAAGYEKNGVFTPYCRFQRTRPSPSLPLQGTLPLLSGQLALRLSDTHGRTLLLPLLSQEGRQEVWF